MAAGSVPGNAALTVPAVLPATAVWQSQESMPHGLPCTSGKSPAFPERPVPAPSFSAAVRCAASTARTTPSPGPRLANPSQWTAWRRSSWNSNSRRLPNINLVTPTHYTPQIIEAVTLARTKGLSIPIVYNCGGYESVETLRSLEGIADIYLTDFKYMQSEPAERYSRAADYPEVARAALAEMVRQQPEARYDDSGMMTSGVIVRHLLLPGHVQNAKAVVKYVYETYGDRVWLSLMNQYTPLPQVTDFPEINRKVTRHEYDRLIRYALSLGVENAFIQEGGTAAESFIPAFDYQGL